MVYPHALTRTHTYYTNVISTANIISTVVCKGDYMVVSVNTVINLPGKDMLFATVMLPKNAYGPWPSVGIVVMKP